jgi:hypothetical protein
MAKINGSQSVEELRRALQISTSQIKSARAELTDKFINIVRGLGLNESTTYWQQYAFAAIEVEVDEIVMMKMQWDKNIMSELYFFQVNEIANKTVTKWAGASAYSYWPSTKWKLFDANRRVGCSMPDIGNGYIHKVMGADGVQAGATQFPITGWVDAEWDALCQPYRDFVVQDSRLWI